MWTIRKLVTYTNDIQYHFTTLHVVCKTYLSENMSYQQSDADTPGWVIPIIAVPWVLFTLNTTCILVYMVKGTSRLKTYYYNRCKYSFYN